MKKYLMFCSNPVNGGTVRMFYELANIWPRLNETDGVSLYPCTNAIREILYGKPASGSSEAVPGRLPLPDEIVTILAQG